MRVSNTPVPLYIGSHMWVIDGTILACGQSSQICQTMVNVFIIHLDTIVQTSHLLPVFGEERVSKTLSFTDTLDTFSGFYINKYADHHAFEIAF
jgi:hypothetical protein